MKNNLNAVLTAKQRNEAEWQLGACSDRLRPGVIAAALEHSAQSMAAVLRVAAREGWMHAIAELVTSGTLRLGWATQNQVEHYVQLYRDDPRAFAAQLDALLAGGGA